MEIGYRRGGRYDPREIRLRRRFEQAIERLGERTSHPCFDSVAGWLARPLAVAADLGRRPFIVVLSGGIRSTGRLNAVTVARVRWGAELMRRGLGGRLIMSGGPRRPGRPAAALAMRELALALGLRDDQVLAEATSSRTNENAGDVARLIAPLGPLDVLLVTSRLHMRRAQLCFRHHGFAAAAAPVPDDVDEGAAGSVVAQVLHESLGLLYYKARGWL